ncbi:MAG: hypothetical protein MAG453_00174 [Calditrichaeota bacterium]|nr:hypothetical protein [Calditrichota bacterium]
MQFPGDDIVWFGTSSFSEKDWVGPFYPEGTQPREFLPYYATRFRTVEVDSTYYAIPRASTVDGWNERTPDGFLFAAKFPKSIVHGGEQAKPDPDKLLDSGATYPDRDRFLARISRLGRKLGPLVIQFPYFNKKTFASAGPFYERLARFLADLPRDVHDTYAVEIRNRRWLTGDYFAILREHRAAPVLVDQAWMPHGDEIAERHDPLTVDWAYIRLLGDRKKIEEVTTNWNREVVDHAASLTRWANLLRQMRTRASRILVYANNHYAGHAPATIRRLNTLYHGTLER